MKFKAYNINYETDGEKVEGLPETFDIEAENYSCACLEGADQISDATGWLINGFDIEK